METDAKSDLSSTTLIRAQLSHRLTAYYLRPKPPLHNDPGIYQYIILRPELDSFT